MSTSGWFDRNDRSVNTTQEKSYKNYMLNLLTVILAFNFVDRLALGLLLQDIKLDLSLSDTQLGFLTGIAFALFYSIMGIPIARWADRGNRPIIIAVTAAIWSVTVALCGIATSFVQLLVIRVGVAIGEAGCVPPAHSLIAEHFKRAERPRALARYMLGGPLAITIGYFSAGWLNELYGWRATFALLGLPGLVLAALAWGTLKEPRIVQTSALHAARSSRLPSHSDSSVLSTKSVLRTLLSIQAFRHLLLAFSVFFFFGYGVLQWQPAFFIRTHGLGTAELGVWFAFVIGLATAIGTYLGGELATRYAAGDERRQLSASAIVFVGLAVVKTSAYLAPSYLWALGAITLATVGGSIVQGPLYATIQTLVPSHMRAMAIAFVYLFANLIGMGLGPLAVGAISDVLHPWLGQESLRYALVILCPGYLWVAWHVWRASRTVERDLKDREIESSRCATCDPEQ